MEEITIGTVLTDALTSAPGVMLLHFDPASGCARIAEHPAAQVVEAQQLISS